VAAAVKKLPGELSKDIALLDELSLVFPFAQPLALILKAILAEQKKRTKLLEDALESSIVHGLRWLAACCHHWLGGVDVRDTQKEAADKLKHVDSAAEMFVRMGVTEGSLLL